jgi:hypothetical protein
VFPVRYDLKFYILCARNSIFKALKEHSEYAIVPLDWLCYGTFCVL